MRSSAILHVGAPKCGSSALQSALSQAPELEPKGSGAGARYVVLRKNATLVHGSGLTTRAAASDFGYLASPSAQQLAEMDDEVLHALAAGINGIAGEHTVLLSNEGWLGQHAIFRERRLLEHLGLQAKVIMYIRPQVAWCNSAWWQWGAWSGRPLAQWLQGKLKQLQWTQHARAWSEVPGVTEVCVRLLPKSIVENFCDFVGVVPPAEAVVNPSLPRAVLRLFQRHRDLRPSPHASSAEFAISRHLEFHGEPAPWVLRPEMITRIITACREDNEALCGLLDVEDAARMRADAAWWSEEFWLGRKVASWGIVQANASESDALAAAALAALVRLDRAHRELLASRLPPSAI